MTAMVFLDRSSDRSTQYLGWRMRLFAAGAAIGLVGIFTEIRWLIWVAIAVLVAGFLLRFLAASDEE